MWPLSRRDRADATHADIDLLASASLPTHIGRFRLEDQVLGGRGQRLWRAYDETLHRMVALRLVDPADPLHDDLRAAACAAARVVDRSVVQVLDVLDFEGTLVIVTEWVSAIPLEQLLTTAMTPAQSVEVTRRVAQAVAHIHAAGVTHGRIRPASVMINKDGEVRLRGHMIDARIYGIEPGTDPAAADISGLGAILTACLTGRWPGDTPTALPAAPVVGGRRAVPSQLRADLPQSLDTFVVRAMAAVPSPEMVPTRHPFPNAPAAVDGLAGLQEGTGSLRHLHRRTSIDNRASALRAQPSRIRSRTRRVFAVAGIALCAFAIGIVGARLFAPATGDASAAIQVPASDSDAIPERATIENAGESRVAPQPTPSEHVLPIAATFNLKANGKGIVPTGSSTLAVDTNPVSAWRTPLYAQPNILPANAAGIVIDLGEVRQIRAVSIGLLGNNTALEIRTAERLGKTVSKYQVLQKVSGAGTSITLREAQPMATRYVLVLPTSVPKSKGKTYQGGISTIQILG